MLDTEAKCKTCTYIEWMKNKARERNVEEKKEGFKTYVKANIGMETFKNRVHCGSCFVHICKLKYCPECGRKW